MALLSAIHDAKELLAEAPGEEECPGSGAQGSPVSGGEDDTRGAEGDIPVEDLSAMNDMISILGTEQL